MGYTKLDAGITDSTIWQAPDTTRIVWITLLAMADQNGYIGASMPGLAGRARVSQEACIAALDTFMAPDEWSRTQDFEGRRLAEAEGGWVLLNHAKYRAAEDAEKRRERSRIAMAKLRERRREGLTVKKVNRGELELPQAEAEAEADTKATKQAQRSENAREEEPDQDLETLARDLVAIWPGKHQLLAVQRELGQAWKELPPSGKLIADVQQRIAVEWANDPARYSGRLESFIRGRKWLEPVTDRRNGNGKPVAAQDPPVANGARTSKPNGTSWDNGALVAHGGKIVTAADYAARTSKASR